LIAETGYWIADIMDGRLYTVRCVPSQKGAFFECLQAHQATFFASAITTCLGVKPVPLCEPSQNGWVFELPQAHQE